MDLSLIRNHRQAGDQTLGLMLILVQKWKANRFAGGTVLFNRTRLNQITTKIFSGTGSVHWPTSHYQTKQIITITVSLHQDWIITASKENLIRKKIRLA